MSDIRNFMPGIKKWLKFGKVGKSHIKRVQ